MNAERSMTSVTVKFLPNLPTVWTPAHLKASLTKAGIPFLEPTQMLSYHIAFVLRNRRSRHPLVPVGALRLAGSLVAAAPAFR